MVPGVFGAGVTQFNLVVSTAIASLLPTGAVSYLYYADRLNQLPLAVVGIAVGTAILPPLSRQLRLKDEAGAVTTQNRGLELALLLTLPAAVALGMAAKPILAGAVPARPVRAGRNRRHRGGAHRLCRGPARLRAGEGAGARLFRPPRHRHAGQDGARLHGDELALDAAPGLGAALRPCPASPAPPRRRVGSTRLLLFWLLHRRGHFVLDRRVQHAHPAHRWRPLLMGLCCLGAERCLLAPWPASGLVLRLAALAVLVGGGLAVFACLALVLGAAEWQRGRGAGWAGPLDPRGPPARRMNRGVP